MLIFFKGVHQSRFINVMSAVSVFVVAIAADSPRHMIVLDELNVIQDSAPWLLGLIQGAGCTETDSNTITLPLMNTYRAASCRQNHVAGQTLQLRCDDSFGLRRRSH